MTEKEQMKHRIIERMTNQQKLYEALVPFTEMNSPEELEKLALSIVVLNSTIDLLKNEPLQFVDNYRMFGPAFLLLCRSFVTNQEMKLITSELESWRSESQTLRNRQNNYTNN